MNIISAWKAAKVGQKIRRASTVHAIEITKVECDMSDYRDFHFSPTHGFLDALVRDGHPDHRIFDTHVLADDWEVVKTPKKITIPFAAVSTLMTQKYIHTVPPDAQVTIEWEE